METGASGTLCRRTQQVSRRAGDITIFVRDPVVDENAVQIVPPLGECSFSKEQTRADAESLGLLRRSVIARFCLSVFFAWFAVCLATVENPFF